MNKGSPPPPTDIPLKGFLGRDGTVSMWYFGPDGRVFIMYFGWDGTVFER